MRADRVAARTARKDKRAAKKVERLENKLAKVKSPAKIAMKKSPAKVKGGKMPMAKDPKSGKMVPAFAIDGKGKNDSAAKMKMQKSAGEIVKKSPAKIAMKKSPSKMAMKKTPAKMGHAGKKMKK